MEFILAGYRPDSFEGEHDKVHCVFYGGSTSLLGTQLHFGDSLEPI